MTKFFYIYLISIAVLLIQTSEALAHAHHSEASSRGTLNGQSIYNLKTIWTNQEGRPQSLEQLRGHNVILLMAYTSCEHACPLLIEDAKLIEQKLGQLGFRNFSFVLCSFDSVRDTPVQLKAFALKRHLDPSRWTLLNGNTKAVRELAAVLGVKYSKDSYGDFDHSNIIHLINSEGVVVHQQIGLNQKSDELLTSVKKLEESQAVSH